MYRKFHWKQNENQVSSIGKRLRSSCKSIKKKLQRLALALQIPFYNFDSRREKKSFYTVYEIDDLSAHTVEITEFYCHATVFSQKFRQINVLLKNFTVNWFDGKNFAWQWISRFSTLCARNIAIKNKEIDVTPTHCC